MTLSLCMTLFVIAVCGGCAGGVDDEDDKGPLKNSPAAKKQLVQEVLSDDEAVALADAAERDDAGEVADDSNASEPVPEKPAAPTTQVKVNSDAPAPVAGMTKYDALIAGLTIFVLAIFVGFEVITKVPPTLHTPLMSGSNAISGITIVGAIIVASTDNPRYLFDFAPFVGLFAVIFASINVVGGFYVTHRMLSMFKKKK